MAEPTNKVDDLLITTALLLGAEFRMSKSGIYIEIDGLRGLWSTRQRAAAVYLTECHGLEILRDGTVWKYPEVMSFKVRA